MLALWVLALLISTFASRAIGTNFTNTFTLPNTPSTEALAVLERVAPQHSGDIERIVFKTSSGLTVSSPVVVQRINTMLVNIASLPHVSYVQSPYAHNAAQISKGGTIAFANVGFNVIAQGVSTKEALRFVARAHSADTHGIEVAVSGQIAGKAISPSIGGSLPGIVLAGIVLLLVFGSLAAMALPLVSALASLGTAIGVIGVLSNVMKMPEFSTQLVLLIGLGVGIDYALFIVTRHRQGLLAGLDTEASVIIAVNTSGRAVLFAGIIVCIALLGMFALGVSFLFGLAVASSIGVAFTMLAALTLLPALLGFFGPRVLSGRQRRRLSSEGYPVVGARPKGFWPRWSDFQSRRPLLAGGAALFLVVLVALPFFSMRLGQSDQGNDQTGSTTRIAYDMLATGFGPGYNGPLIAVVVSHNGSPVALLGRLAQAISTHSDVASVRAPITLPSKDGTTVSLLTVVPSSSPQAAATTALIDSLRGVTVPALVHGTGVTVLIGGTTAVFVDFTRVLASKLPLFIVLVVFLSFLLLAIVFRSLVIPLTAAAMNILSIGAAFGVLVAVFQQGTLAGFFGVNGPGPVESFLPVMLFAILFGLSMDYEVFLISRIHEEWLRTGDNRTAVRNGLASTGKTITAAALIMILIFGAFILGGERVIKEFGLGLAAGIFIDAVLIRMALVPGAMFLLGRANWWFPHWLDKILPRAGIDAMSIGGDEIDEILPTDPAAVPV